MEAEVGVVVEEDIDIQRERLIGVALGSVVVKRRKKNSVGGGRRLEAARSLAAFTDAAVYPQGRLGSWGSPPAA